MKYVMTTYFIAGLIIEEIPEGTTLVQYQVPNGPQGNYYSKPNVDPSDLGISDKARDWNTGEIVQKTANTYTTDSPVSALRSSAASINDTWSIPGETIPTRRGAIQYFTMSSDAILPN